MTINHREQVRHFFQCIEHRRADVFLITYLVFYIPLKYILHPGLIDDFFIVIEMFATLKRWHFPHDKGCVFYTTETYRTHHMLENCAPHYLSIKSPQKLCFIHIIILLIIVQELHSLNSISFKLLNYKHYWYAVSFI